MPSLMCIKNSLSLHYSKETDQSLHKSTFEENVEKEEIWKNLISKLRSIYNHLTATFTWGSSC